MSISPSRRLSRSSPARRQLPNENMDVGRLSLDHNDRLDYTPQSTRRPYLNISLDSTAFKRAASCALPREPGRQSPGGKTPPPARVSWKPKRRTQGPVKHKPYGQPTWQDSGYGSRDSTKLVPPHHLGTADESSTVTDPPASPRWPSLILQPDSSPISEDQLAAEIKSIYAGLVIVEAKCIDIDAVQACDPLTQLDQEQSEALEALHRTLRYEHHDVLAASQHPLAPGAIQALPVQYGTDAKRDSSDAIIGSPHDMARRQNTHQRTDQTFSTSEMKDPLQRYWDRRGDVAVFRERLCELDFTYEEGKCERELLKDQGHDLKLLDDASCSQEYREQRLQIESELERANLEAETLRDACGKAGLSTERRLAPVSKDCDGVASMPESTALMPAVPRGNTKLEEDIGFVPFSYTWGDDVGQQEISIDGVAVKVRRHLHEFLTENAEIMRRIEPSSIGDVLKDGRSRRYEPESFHEPEVLGRLAGVEESCLPDKGACGNFLSHSLIKRRGIDFELQTPFGMKMANGRLATVIGTAKLPFSYRDESEVHHLDFLVLAKSVRDVILGSPFLKLTQTFEQFAHRITRKLRGLRRHGVCLLAGPERMSGYLDGIPVDALPDTGSDTMLMSAAYAKRYGYRISRDQEHQIELEFADGSISRASGLVEGVEWAFDGYHDKLLCDFHVLDGLQCDVLLSYDFLWQTDAFAKSDSHDHIGDAEAFTVDDWALCTITRVRRAVEQVANLTVPEIAEEQARLLQRLEPIAEAAGHPPRQGLLGRSRQRRRTAEALYAWEQSWRRLEESWERAERGLLQVQTASYDDIDRDRRHGRLTAAEAAAAREAHDADWAQGWARLWAAKPALPEPAAAHLANIRLNARH